MPVRRGHVAPQNTYLDTIIRKFEGQSECVRWVGARSGALVRWQEWPDPLLTSNGAGWGVSDAERISFPSMSGKHFLLQRAPTFSSNATLLSAARWAKCSSRLHP